MFNIKTLNKIAAIGTDNFDRSKYALADDMENPDAILVRSGDMLSYELNDNLMAIARAGAGVNNIPIDRCTEKGIVVFNTPGANANAVKELALAAMLVASRDIVGGINWINGLKDANIDVPKEVEKGKSAFVGPELTGKTLGVVGLGAIGAMVANMGHALGMEVWGYDPYLTVEGAWSLSKTIKRANSLKALYEKADYICLHAPVTPETKGSINAEAIASMKKSVRIINLSRADLVNDADMAAALENGEVARYVTDFPNSATLKMKNAVCIPHLGASTPESEDNCAVMAVNEIIDFLENGNIKNSVNFPDLKNPGEGDISLCVFHKNIPNILAQISAAFSAENINIENMSSRSKKDYAYTVCEIMGTYPASVLDTLRAIEGIIRVNVVKN